MRTPHASWKRAFCVKCRSKVDLIDAQIKRNKRGVPYSQGTCPVCSKKANTFVTKRSIAEAEAEDTPQEPQVETE